MPSGNNTNDANNTNEATKDEMVGLKPNYRTSDRTSEEMELGSTIKNGQKEFKIIKQKNVILNKDEKRRRGGSRKSSRMKSKN